MQFKNLLADDDAVSPVIGVILMVAITVILAAVIGTFVLGLGDQVQQTSPTAQFSFDYVEDYDGSGNAQLTVTHDGGDGITASDLKITNGGTTYSHSDTSPGGSDFFVASASDSVSAGDSAILQEDSSFDPTSDATVVWNAADGDRSSTLAEWEA